MDRNYDMQLSKASKTLLGSETDMIDKLYVGYGVYLLLKLFGVLYIKNNLDFFNAKIKWCGE